MDIKFLGQPQTPTRNLAFKALHLETFIIIVVVVVVFHLVHHTTIALNNLVLGWNF